MGSIRSGNPSAGPNKLGSRVRSTALRLLVLAFSVFASAPSYAESISASPNPSNNGSYTVSWSGVNGAQSYPLQESFNGGAWVYYNVSPTSKSFTGKAPGSYRYTIGDCLALGPPGHPTYEFQCGYDFGIVTVTVRPPVPSGLTAPSTDHDGAYTVSWNTSSGATSYQLQERFNSGSWLQIHSGSATSKSRSGRAPGSWSYQVRACLGTNCSNWSSTRTVNVSPGAPTGLTAPATDYNGSYTVSWNASSGATSYRLQEKVGSTWTQIHSGSATSKAVSGKSPGTYSYRVRGCGSACGTWSSTITVTVKPAPSVPSGLSGPATDYNGAYTVSWNTATGATSYKLQERLGSGSWSQIHSGSATSKAISGNSPGTYSYRVQGCGPESVCSGWSSSITVTVAAPPPAPSGLTGPSTDYNGAYTISWNSSSGASTYRLHERIGSGSWSQVHSGAAISKAISGKSAGSYSYRVRGCNAESVCGSWSGYVDVIVESPPDTPAELNGPEEPVPPDESYTISWSETGSDLYELQEQLAGGDWQPIPPGSELLSRTLSNAPGVYSYQVRACNPESVCSGWSSPITVTVQIAYITNYQYDAQGRLIRAKHPDGVATDYEYDSAGNRTSKESVLEN